MKLDKFDDKLEEKNDRIEKFWWKIVGAPAEGFQLYNA